MNIWYKGEEHPINLVFPDDADIDLYLKKNNDDFEELDIEIKKHNGIYETKHTIDEEGDYVLKAYDNNSKITKYAMFIVIKKEVFTDDDRDTLNSIYDNTKLLVDIEQGNWKIKDKQMIFYDSNDNEIMRFNLYDKNGERSEKVVYSRERVNG